MKFFALASSLAAVAQLALAQSGAKINTPATLTTCVPTQLSWSGGSAPYYVSILPGGTTTGALYQFPAQQGTSLTWTVNAAAGTSLTFSITDSSGVTNYSDQVSVNAGSDTSCVSSSLSGGSSSGGSSAAAGGASSSASATGSSSGSSSGSGASSGSQTTAASASSPSSSTTKNSGAALKISGAAVIGAAVFAAL